tara:strand:- start:6869 stop:7063 length:195 start_codon:yes stop_codon:yes gene_type:complete
MTDLSSIFPRFLRLKDVIKSTSLSRSTIYRSIDKGEFPQPIRLTKGRVVWLEKDILEWLRGLGV